MPDVTTTMSVRDAILEGAIQTIDAKGEAGIRVRDLVDSVGVTAPVLYRAFGSREGLIIAAQTERYRRALYLASNNFLDRLVDVTTAEQFRGHMEWVLDIVLSDQRADHRRVRLNVMGSAITRPELLESIITAEDAFVHELIPVMDDLREKGWVRPDLASETFLHWYLAVVNARGALEIRGSSIDARQWDSQTRAAILVNLFGDTRRTS